MQGIWDSIWNSMTLSNILVCAGILVTIIGIWVPVHLFHKKTKLKYKTRFKSLDTLHNDIWFRTHLYNMVNTAFFNKYYVVLNKSIIPKHHPEDPEPLKEVKDYIIVRIKKDDVKSCLRQGDLNQAKCFIVLDFTDLGKTKYRQYFTWELMADKITSYDPIEI